MLWWEDLRARLVLLRMGFRIRLPPFQGLNGFGLRSVDSAPLVRSTYSKPGFRETKWALKQRLQNEANAKCMIQASALQCEMAAT